MRLRIKSRKVSTAPQWISKYLPAHTATADEIVQRYMDNELKFIPKQKRNEELKRFITKKWLHNIKVLNRLVDKYVLIETFNPLTIKNK